MKNFIILLKANFSANPFISTSAAGDKKPRSKVAASLLLVLVAAFMVFFSASISYTFMAALHPFGLGAYVPAMLYFAGCILTLLTSVGHSRTMLFGAKDTEMLLSLPVTYSSVLLSKLTVMYIYELMFFSLIYLPSYVVYMYLTSFTLSGIITMLITLLFAPMIPIAAGMLVAFIAGIFLRKAKRKNLLQVVFFAVFMVAYFYFVYSSNSIFSYIAESGVGFASSLGNAYYPAALLYGAIGGNILSLLVFVLFNALIMTVAVLLLSKFFMRMVAFLRQTDKTRKFKGTGIRTASCFKALLKKELSRFTSSATYMTNCGFGAVMLLLMGVGSFFLSDELIAQFGLNAEEAESIIPMIITCAMMFFACLSPTTYPSISLEGSSFWILKSAPVREKTILGAKVALNLVIYLPAVIVSGILLSIRFGLGIAESAFTLLVPAAAVCLTTILGLLINLKLPRFDQNDVKAIKQSFNAFLATMSNMIIVVLLSFLIFIFPSLFSGLLIPALFTVFAIILIFDAGLYALLCTTGVRMLSKISA